MQDRLVEYTPRPGRQTLLAPAPGVLDFIRLELVSLAAGAQEAFFEAAHESVFVLLNGAVEFRTAAAAWSATRTNVFEAPAASLYAPAGCRVEIHATAASEIAVATAAATPRGAPRFYGPESVAVREFGRDNWQRAVKTLQGADGPAQVLIVGETINPGGNWSSYPPHRHDFDRPPEEIAMEEVYFYRFQPANGFGFQRIYTADRRQDHTWCVRHNTALPIYEGFHPVVTAGGYQLYYLWILAGKKKELVPFTDPEYRWVMEQQKR